MDKMFRRALIVATMASSILAPLGSSAQAQTALVVHATSQVAANISSTMPLVRLHFSAPVSATKLPTLRFSPALATRWQQISASDVQAVAVGAPAKARLLRHYSADLAAVRRALASSPRRAWCRRQMA